MPVPSMACRRELIGLFLNDSLSDVEQAAFEEHLATCADCREELSASAAEPELWSEAAEALSDDAIECGVSAPLWIEPTDEDDDAERNPARRQNSERAGTPHAKVQVPAVQAVLNLLAPTDDPHKLGRLSGYEIAGVIGCGGMGVVLKGFDASLNRFVAIKVLAAHLASSGAARRRFARQAQAAAAVVHDNVVAIHGVAEANEMPYLVMPYIRRIDVDVDSNKQLVATYRVTAIPTFIRCFEGNEVERGGTRWNEVERIEGMASENRVRNQFEASHYRQVPKPKTPSTTVVPPNRSDSKSTFRLLSEPITLDEPTTSDSTPVRRQPVKAKPEFEDVVDDAPANPPTDVVVKVNDKPITYRDLVRMGLTLGEVEGAINFVLIIQAAEKASITVSEKEIDAESQRKAGERPVDEWYSQMSTDRGLNREAVREFIVRPALLLQKLAGDDLKQQAKFLKALQLAAKIDVVDPEAKVGPSNRSETTEDLPSDPSLKRE